MDCLEKLRHEAARLLRDEFAAAQLDDPQKIQELRNILHAELFVLSAKVRLADRNLIWMAFLPHLERMIAVRRPLPESEPPKIGGGKVAKKKISGRNEARDKWIYRECCKGTAYGTISRTLKSKHPKWDHIESETGILAAAKRYARRHSLEPPSPRLEQS